MQAYFTYCAQTSCYSPVTSLLNCEYSTCDVSLQLLSRRLRALGSIPWTSERKQRMERVLTQDVAIEYMSSDEEVEGGKAKKVIPWQSEDFRQDKEELDKFSFKNAGPRAKNALAKYIGMGSASNTLQPEEAPLWVLKR